MANHHCQLFPTAALIIRMAYFNTIVVYKTLILDYSYHIKRFNLLFEEKIAFSLFYFIPRAPPSAILFYSKLDKEDIRGGEPWGRIREDNKD